MFKKRVKRLLALIIACSMLTAVFAGCSNEKPDEKTPASNGGTGSTESEKTNEKTEPERIVVYTYPLGIAVQNPSKPDDLKRVQDYIAEQCGVFVDMVMAPAGSETEKLNTLLASDEQIDAFVGDWGSYYNKNVIIPLNDLIDEYGKNVKAAWTDEAWATATGKDGSIWCVTKSTPTTPYPAFVREDWLKEYGLDMPTDFESLENVLKTFKEKDPTGNGQTIPLLTDSVANLSMVLSAGYTGVGYNIRYKDPADQKIKPMVYNPDYKEFIAKMAEWYKNGYIYRESFAKPQIRDLIKANKVGVNATWYSNITFSEPVLSQNVAEGHYEIANIKGPKSELSESPSIAGRNGTMITKRCKNPEAVMKFIDWGYADVENFMIAKDGIKGVDWEYANEELKINRLLNPENPTYRNELAYLLLGVAIEQKLNTESFEDKIHYEYIRNKNLAFDRVVKPDEFTTIYDAQVVKDEIPMQTDIHTMIEENLTGFVTGTKPMSEWDSFLKDLEKAGLETYIEVYTREFNQANK